MNFFKIRQKNTGLFFVGGNGTGFNENGERYHTKNPCTAALNRIERQRPAMVAHLGVKRWTESAEMSEWWDGRKTEVDNLHPDNLEIVEYQEVEVAVHPKPTKKK